MLLIIASQPDEFDDLSGRLVRESLPQASHHACHERRGERRAIVVDDASTSCYDRGRTSHRHHIGLDATVGSRTDSTEGSIDTLRIDTAHSDNILGIGRKVDAFPGSHTIIASRIDADNTFVCQHRGSMRDERRLSVLLGITMTRRGIIEIMISQRRIDDVYPHTVGIFGSLGPVVFLGKTLRTLVLAAHQEIGGLGSHTYIIIRHIGSHDRKHHRAVLHL